MKATMKKSRIWLLAILPILALLTAATILIATAETPTPSVDIVAQNLEFANNIYIKYAVKVTGVEDPSADQFGLLYWTEPHDTYEKGTEKLSENSSVTGTVLGESCYIFTYKDLAAKQMADDIYARAYIEVDGNIYYSDVQKYSILQYAYNMLGITSEPTEKESLKTLLRDMLQYGASAQLNFNYRTDRLANADFHQITVEGGTLPDGSTKGLYIAGETVTLTANERNAAGEAFSHWTNSAGEQLGTDLAYTATVGEQNETYTAQYLTVTPDEYFTFTLLSDDTYSIAAKDVNNIPDTVVLPTAYQDKRVTAISNSAFRNCTALTSVRIPDGIKTISSTAFYGCTSLKDVSIGNSVYYIGSYAFYNCSSLIDITLPNAITDIQMYTFEGCSSLENITIPSNTTHIFASAFKDCVNITNIVIPDKVVSIESEAFSGCSGLTNINIPDSVTNIGISAFDGCDGIIEIEDSVSYVKKWAIDCEESATSATLRTDTVGIASNAFYHCTSLISIDIPEGVSVLGGSAFSFCTALTNIVIPDTVSSIGAYAFEDCYALTSITIGVGVTNIGGGAFRDCSALTRFYITDLTGWCHISFGDMYSNPLMYASEFYLDDVLTTDLIIPNNVTRIENYAFYNFSNLSSIEIPAGVLSIGQYAFSNCSALSEIVIPGSVTSIGQYAFHCCSNLTTAVLESGIKSIGKYAFVACTALTNIDLPDSITSIGENAFNDCTNIIEIENGIWYVDKWVIYAYSTDTAVKLRADTIGIADHGLACGAKELTIPEGVKYIGKYGLANSWYMETIVIPKSIVSIGADVLYNTTGGQIYYSGSVTDWNTIVIERALDFSDKTIYYYSETEPTDSGNYWHYVDGVPTAW